MPDRGRPGSIAARLAAATRLVAIEDEADIAEFLRAYFRASGYDVVHVDPASVEDALAAIEEARPQVVLLDYGLRGFSGHEVYRELRNEPRHDHTPIVVVTADATAQQRALQLASPIDGFVTKPFNAHTLADTVAGLLDAARAGARAGRGEPLELVSARVLHDEMADLLGSSGARAVALALVQVRSGRAIRHRAGDDALDFALGHLQDRVHQAIGPDARFRRTDAAELAVLVPDCEADVLAQSVDGALAGLPAELDLPGGESVPLEVAVGVAACPEHASSADELYMAADAALADAADSGRRVQVAL